MSDLNYTHVIRFGLPPYDKFVEALSSLLRRVPAKQRNNLVKKMYDLSVIKVEMETVKQGTQSQATKFRERRMLLSRTRTHIRNALEELWAAKAAFSKEVSTEFDFRGVILKLDEFERHLDEGEKSLPI